MGDKFKIYIIFTSKSLEDIYKIILDNSDNVLEIGPLRKDYTRDIRTGKYLNSNRRFIILSENIYDKLVKNGYGDENNNEFYIDNYQIRGENKAPLDSVMHYYYPKSDENKIKMTEKLKFFETMGFFKSEDYKVHDCIVEFSNRVNNYFRIIIKIILDDINCRVSWCRKKTFSKITHFF